MKKYNKKSRLSPIKKTAAIAALGLAAGGAVWGLSKINPTMSQAKVYKVVDGDTIKTDPQTLVRLIGINAPEEKQCYYAESRTAVEKFLEGKKVILEKEISGTDNYGRLLRYAILPNESEKKDNILVNDYIVRQGWARAIASVPNNRYRDLLNSAQEEAIRHNRGLWANCEYEDELSERREQDNPPPGPEYVVKGNISTRGYGKTYLVPGCDNYNNVKIDFSKGEKYFRTIKEAEKEGFREATNCP